MLNSLIFRFRIFKKQIIAAQFSVWMSHTTFFAFITNFQQGKVLFEVTFHRESCIKSFLYPVFMLYLAFRLDVIVNMGVIFSFLICIVWWLSFIRRPSPVIMTSLFECYMLDVTCNLLHVKCCPFVTCILFSTCVPYVTT